MFRENITDKQLKVIRLLSEKFHKIVIGGSVALNYYGLVCRPVGDIDVIIHRGTKPKIRNLTSTRILNDLDSFVKYIGTGDVFGDVPIDAPEPNENNYPQEDSNSVEDRRGIIVDGVKICLFHNKRASYELVDLFGNDVYIGNPYSAIKAKRRYIRRSNDVLNFHNCDYIKKHKEDIKSYRKITRLMQDPLCFERKHSNDIRNTVVPDWFPVVASITTMI